MGAGESARYASQCALFEADQLRLLEREARDKARRYGIASQAERSVAGKLTGLTTLGWHVLADRQWAGSQRANVDFLIIGPGGVVVVDVKAWRALEVRSGSVYCGDARRDDEVDKLLRLTDRVEERLTAHGLTSQAIWPALVFSGRRVNETAGRVALVGEANVAEWLTHLGKRLTSNEIDALVAALTADFPPYLPGHRRMRKPRPRFVHPRPEAGHPDAGHPDAGHPDAGHPDAGHRDAGHRDAGHRDALFGVDQLTDAILTAELAEPIERWMTFLHPDQLRLVRTHASGPSRLRGPAGTGKTVVGLHRATYLAERSTSPILFVTFVRTLPLVMAGLCARMAPHVRTRIEFTGLHQLAGAVLREGDCDVHIDSSKIDTAFAHAWRARRGRGVLERLDERPAYWQEEIDHVIKGRGITDFEDYAQLPRYGRGTPMQLEHRQAMWELYVDYQSRLDRGEFHDFNDLLIAARDLLSDGTVKLDYGGVIVDEVQDLTLVGLEMLHAIAGDGPNRFLIMGDGQQAVYPGGFRLAEAGIAVTGRATVLRTNYRNAAEILQVAARVVAGDDYEDVEGVMSSEERDVRVARGGGSVVEVHADDQRSIDHALVGQIETARREHDVPLGDMAVLARRNRDVDHYNAVLRRADIGCVRLEHYAGVIEDRIKLGTVKRAKGLEFKYVLLPGLPAGSEPRWPGESDEAYRERAMRMRRELYVAMTRARDGLWLGFVDE